MKKFSYIKERIDFKTTGNNKELFLKEMEDIWNLINELYTQGKKIKGFEYRADSDYINLIIFKFNDNSIGETKNEQI